MRRYVPTSFQQRNQQYKTVRASARMPAQPPIPQQEKPKSFYVWSDPEHWTCPDVAGNIQCYKMSEMGDEHLWTTINYLIANCAGIYVTETQPEVRPGSDFHQAGAHWLKMQPAFIGLVFEAIARGLTFLETTATFLRKYLATNTAPVEAAPPWRQPFSPHTLTELKDSIGKQLNAAAIAHKYGKSPRAVRISKPDSGES